VQRDRRLASDNDRRPRLGERRARIGAFHVSPLASSIGTSGTGAAELWQALIVTQGLRVSLSLGSINDTVNLRHLRAGTRA
jgi:hypothetical protein